MAQVAVDKITLRQLKQLPPRELRVPSATDIRQLRHTARLTQAQFGACLGRSAGYVSRLEQGAVRPRGPILVLLDIVHRLGIAMLLS